MRQSILATSLKAAINAYRRIFSPWLGTRCRFAPSCSDYAIQAMDQHGAAKGSIITIKRLCRCHPWGGHGFDPVPGTSVPGIEKFPDAGYEQPITTTPPGGQP